MSQKTGEETPRNILTKILIPAFFMGWVGQVSAWLRNDDIFIVPTTLASVLLRG